MILIKKSNIICGAICLALLLGFFIFKEVNEKWNLKKEAAQAEGVSVSATVRQLIAPEIKITPSAPGGGGGAIIKQAAGSSFRGFAQPRALITFKKDGNIMATCMANDNGEFFKVITGLPPNYYIFSLFSTDEYGRNSITLNFKMKIEENTQSDVFNLFIPPTISVGSSEAGHKELLYISGQTVPGSKIFLLIQPKGELKISFAKQDGRWEYWLETSSLDVGAHIVKTNAETSWGLKSQFGEAVAFEIIAEKKCEIIVDIDCDNKIDIKDLSILLYWWQKKDFYKNPRVDLNHDRKVNLVDFSILLYWWRNLR